MAKNSRRNTKGVRAHRTHIMIVGASRTAAAAATAVTMTINVLCKWDFSPCVPRNFRANMM